MVRIIYSPALAEEYAQRPAEEETINDPTKPKHYWRGRYKSNPVCLELYP